MQVRDSANTAVAANTMGKLLNGYVVYALVATHDREGGDNPPQPPLL